jgi:hypothetical protein
MLHQYEYQEDVYLALDGSASVYISASLPALVALYGMAFPTDPRGAVDRAKIRDAFSAPGVTVSAIRTWRRWGRRFITVGITADNVRRLPGATPFARNSFAYASVPSGYSFVERLGPSVNRAVGNVGWNGAELVGFRWHVPSRIEGHNTREENFLRGNILVWEQPLRKRLAGEPLTMEVHMRPRSILSSALWLFGVSAVTALIAVALLVWWVVRKGRTKGMVTDQAVGGRRY